MKKTLVTMIGVLFLGTVALGAGGNNDSPYALPNTPDKPQGEVKGAVRQLVPEPDTIAVTKPGGKRIVSTDNGAGGQVLKAHWHSQSGPHWVETTAGASDKPKEVVRRHVETIREYQKAETPIHPPAGCKICNPEPPTGG